MGDYLYLKNGSLKFEVHPHQFNMRLHHFSQYVFNRKKKSSQDWLAKWLIDVGIYGSKVVEGFLTFQHRSCQKLAGLSLAGEVVDHIGIYGSKAAEGCLAFRCRSCVLLHINLGKQSHYPTVKQWLWKWLFHKYIGIDHCFRPRLST